MKLNFLFVFTIMTQLIILGLQQVLHECNCDFGSQQVRKPSSLFLLFACVCVSLSEMQLLEFVNPTGEKMTYREKQRCLPISELDKHLHFSDSYNKSNKERNPLMSSSIASLYPAHLMLKWNTFLQVQSSHELNNEYLAQQSSYPSWGFQLLVQHFWG